MSFRALDIEQIGHVYEGLLDHTAKRAREVILGLAGAKNRETEVPLSRLEELAVKNADALVAFLNEETGRNEKALRKNLEKLELIDDHAVLIACGQDPLLARRTVLDRLLALNHQRYAEEVQAGLHDKGKKSKPPNRKISSAAPPQRELLSPPQSDLF